MGLQPGRGHVERVLAHLPAPTGRGPVATALCYHSIGATDGPHSSATLEGLAHQLDWLAAEAEVVPLARVGTRLRAPTGSDRWSP